MRKSGRAVLAALSVIAATAMLLTETDASAAAVKSQMSPPIGTQLAELSGSHTIAGGKVGNTSVAIWGTTAVMGRTILLGGGDWRYGGQAYVFGESRGVWKQVAELKGSETAARDMYGISVAIWRATVVVGAPDLVTGASRAYVFTETAGHWKQTAELKGSGVGAFDLFGASVAISGRTIVVGAPDENQVGGQAYVFTETRGIWKQTAEFNGPTMYAGGGCFGYSVAISGTNVVVSQPGLMTFTVRGGAFVFTKTAGRWKKTAVLYGPPAFSEWGISVAISGTVAVVGAAGYENDSGEAYVFTEINGIWKRTAPLKYTEPETVRGDGYFGYSVAVLGRTIVVGAPGLALETNTGLAYVFTKTDAGWKQVAEVTGSDTRAGDGFGVSVAISGRAAIVGALAFSNAVGHVYLFEA